MIRSRAVLFALAMAATLAAPMAAPAPAEPVRLAQAAEPAAKPPVTTRVKTWSRAKWDAAKAKFKLDRERWKACQADLRTQKLPLHKGRHFLNDCMTRR